MEGAEGKKLLEKLQNRKNSSFLVMDKAYEGADMREKARKYGYVPVVPPKSNRKEPWEYDKKLYKRRNEIERYFLRIKRFRRIFTRYDKLDALYCVNRL